MRAWQVAQLVDATIEGDGQADVVALAPLDRAAAHDMTFLLHGRHAAALARTQARVVLTSEALWRESGCKRDDLTLMFTDHAPWAMAVIYQAFAGASVTGDAAWEGTMAPGVHPSAVVHGTAEVHATAYVGPLCVVEAGAHVGAEARLIAQTYVGANARVGAATVMHPGSRLLWGCVVGDRCVLHAGSVVGADGFGFAKHPRGPEHTKVPQLGTVVLADDVELGANSTVDRATFGATTLGDGCKIDNLVQVGHNATLGKHNVVASQTGIAGSATMGDSITVGAQCGIVGHLTIAAGTTLAARTGVISSLPTPGVYAGAPAMEHRSWLRMMAAMRDLVGLRRRVAALTRLLPPDTKGH